MTKQAHSNQPLRTVSRVVLGSILVIAGVTHLTVARREFQAQVPEWVPLAKDDVVVMSGMVEIGLGSALLVLPRERHRIGAITALFFTAIFPGNISQYRNHVDGFGLDTDRKRGIRLLFQPLLVAAALWSTGPRRARR
jgi:uncharacterized membrane protein